MQPLSPDAPNRRCDPFLPLNQTRHKPLQRTQNCLQPLCILHRRKQPVFIQPIRKTHPQQRCPFTNQRISTMPANVNPIEYRHRPCRFPFSKIHNLVCHTGQFLCPSSKGTQIPHRQLIHDPSFVPGQILHIPIPKCHRTPVKSRIKPNLAPIRPAVAPRRMFFDRSRQNPVISHLEFPFACNLLKKIIPQSHKIATPNPIFAPRLPCQRELSAQLTEGLTHTASKDAQRRARSAP